MDSGAPGDHIQPALKHADPEQNQEREHVPILPRQEVEVIVSAQHQNLQVATLLLVLRRVC